MSTTTLGSPSMGNSVRTTGYTNAVAITPADGTTYVPPVQVYVGVTGDVQIMPAQGTTAVVFAALPAGALIPCKASIVYATLTTASSLVGCY